MIRQRIDRESLEPQKRSAATKRQTNDSAFNHTKYASFDGTLQHHMTKDAHQNSLLQLHTQIGNAAVARKLTPARSVQRAPDPRTLPPEMRTFWQR